MTVEFELAGQRFVGLNGGPHFKFNEAVSFQVHCDTQDEIDHYWDKLTDHGEEGPKSGRVTKAFLQMRKFDIQELERAYGRSS